MNPWTLFSPKCAGCCDRVAGFSSRICAAWTASYTLREQFNVCDLTVEKQIDITTNVLTALRLDNARKLQLIDALIPRVFHRPFVCVRRHRRNQELRRAREREDPLPQRTAGKERSGTRLSDYEPRSLAAGGSRSGNGLDQESLWRALWSGGRLP